MDNVLVMITLLLSCYFLLCIVKPSGLTEVVLVSFCVLTAIIISWGYILSVMNCLSFISCWLILGLITSAASFFLVLFSKNKFIFFELRLSNFLSIKIWRQYTFGDNSIYLNILLLGLITTVFVAGILNLLIVIIVSPHNWDSMTYHLPRMAYYLQHNNLAYFDADYWAQVVQPKNSTLLLIFTFLVFGHNENLTQLVQYFSYWLAVVSVYGITRKIGFARPQSIFAALVSALLVEGIMQATTTQNDLILTAYFGSVIYFLFTFREKRNFKYLYLAAMGVGLAIGTKASSLTGIPSIALISMVLTRVQGAPKIWFKNLLILLGAVILSISAFAIPSGYYDNYRHFGNPIGNQDVADIHSFSGKSVSYIVRGGTYNVFRYGFNSLSFDGLPALSLVNKMQYLLRYIPRQIFSLAGVNLETSEATSFAPFKYDRRPFAHDEHSYWGILGFGLLWIAVVVSLFRFRKNPDSFLLSLAAIVFFIIQAYSGPYDASRGRYFSIAGMFASPVVCIFLTINNRAFRVYLAAIILVGCISGLSASLIKTTRLSATYPEKLPSELIYSMDRIQQLTFKNL